MVTNETKIVAERIAAAKGEITDAELSRQSAIARSTLQRNLLTGDFKMSEFFAVSRTIGVKPSELVADLPGDAA
jgi:hypothetical protein